MKKTVLFLCTHNSARSQMAEAYLNRLYGDRYEAHSAGITPTRINPYVVKVMGEEGIDLSGARSKSMDEYLDRNFDLVVTVCDSARESCPIFPGDELIHHAFRDPSTLRGSEDEVLAQVREIRDEIREWVTEYFK
ncbi:ArsC family transcriptional regulator [Candidatus Bathyarchaeota archaeon RBG_16_57_9]|nr:MAG: ArsC family transcriptional regulator [Candidatus Bathyarchaeota archaeon RBG_16_57_9]